MGVVTSTGSAGDCFDNAMAESFFATLECGLVDRRSFQIRAEARMAIFAFLESWYGTRRRHSALGYLSPNEFERREARSTGQSARALVELRSVEIAELVRQPDFLDALGDYGILLTRVPTKAE